MTKICFTLFALLLSSASYADIAGLRISADGTIFWTESGYFQVQDSSTYESLCEGFIDSCDSVVTGESYNVINHTNGNRSDNVLVNMPMMNTPSMMPMVTVMGNTCRVTNEGTDRNYECVARCPTGRDMAIGVACSVFEVDNPSNILPAASAFAATHSRCTVNLDRAGVQSAWIQTTVSCLIGAYDPDGAD